MQRLSRLPFDRLIIPQQGSSNDNASTALNILPPLYARDPNFTFSLEAILKDTIADLSMDPKLLADRPPDVNLLKARTDLDRGQCEALLAALSREFAFIQGPPGTGKSYLGVQLMRVLQDCKSKARLGPVVVV